MKRRRLVSIRRDVSAEQLRQYARDWRTLQRGVEASGAHAWRFVSAAYPSRYLEFLEFAAGADPRQQPGIARALAALEMIAPAVAEEWDEAQV